MKSCRCWFGAPSFRAMRKSVAVFLSLSLLIISSVPMSVEAASCAMPAHVTVVDQVMENEHGHHEHHDDVISTDLEHEHNMALMGDWQKDRIECGCGCHRNVDSLPHLLAPHTIAVAQLQTDTLPAQVLIQLSPALIADAPRIPVPPPQFS